MSMDLSDTHWARLQKRAELARFVRSFLDSRGYTEVATPTLLSGTVVDAHIDPISFDIAGQRFFLQTSPELAMKRLLADGAGSIYQLSPVFRSGEAGDRHNPEFTMLEWYRVDGRYHDLMSEVGELVCSLLTLPTPERITYRQAFFSATGLDPFAVSLEELRERSSVRGFSDPSADRDDLLQFLMADAVEPTLCAPTFIYDYPATQSALARVRNDHPPVAERFELYLNGVELCNGYQELTDADELHRRVGVQNELRIRKGKRPLPMPKALIDAMKRGLPTCSGVALGFDRLVMVATGAHSIRDILAIPFDHA